MIDSFSRNALGDEDPTLLPRTGDHRQRRERLTDADAECDEAYSSQRCGSRPNRAHELTWQSTIMGFSSEKLYWLWPRGAGKTSGLTKRPRRRSPDSTRTSSMSATRRLPGAGATPADSERRSSCAA